jgi:transposase
VIPAFGVGRIWLHRGPADLRRSYDGLAGLVRVHFDGTLFTGALFVFVNRRRTQVKILYWCGDGLAIWAKRLERGTFRVPPADAARAELSTAELSMLLEGITPLRVNRRYRRVLPSGGG